MARRARKGGSQTGWAVAAIVVAALLLVWWLSARRAEAPGLPASQPGARALSEVPGPPGAHEDGHGEITEDEKQDLERILRERSAAPPGS